MRFFIAAVYLREGVVFWGIVSGGIIFEVSSFGHRINFYKSVDEQFQSAHIKLFVLFHQLS